MTLSLGLLLFYANFLIIARFLARKFNLTGKNEEESAQIDA